MRVLGFDPSMTNFGWCLIDTDLPDAQKVVARGRFQTTSKTLYIARYIQLRQNVVDLVRKYDVRTLGCESPVFGELYSEGLYGLFLYLSEALYTEKCDLVFFSPSQVKSHARAFLKRPRVNGKLWKMEKPDMVEAAKADTGGKGVWNHNEADAYWVARTAARFWQFLEGTLTALDLTEDETYQFAHIHKFQRGEKKGTEVKRGLLYREDDRFFRWSGGEDE